MQVSDAVLVEVKPMEGREVEATIGAVLGREGTDIVVPDPEVSRRHAAVREHGGGVAIEDLGSTNGTFVNDRKVEGVQPLSDGDELRLGNTVFRVRAAAAADTGATTVGNAQVGAPQVTAARAIPSDLGAPPTQQQPAQPAAPAAPSPAPAAPAPAAQAPAPAPAPANAPRGDVPAPPEVVPSAVRRVLPPPAPGNAPAFLPDTGHRITSRRGSAAQRIGPTILCMLIVIAVAAAVAIYFASQGT
jgi:predicted component of type VI protein secretion system